MHKSALKANAYAYKSNVKLIIETINIQNKKATPVVAFLISIQKLPLAKGVAVNCL
jgi:hypothetical protein